MLTSREIYERLITGYGQPDWWPGTPYAIMVTAILVQNTAWSNVEKAVAEMGERLMPEYIESLTDEELQPLRGTLVDFMTIYSKEDISVTFKDGTEIHID